MVLFNYATREITAKIVYYGPGLCGKTTNLQFIYDSLPSTSKSKMLSLATKTDRTLFFDFLPLELGKIRGMNTKLQLYTVPGQVYYNSTRQLVLKGADGIVFVADSQDFALDANLESLQNLEDNLKKQGIRLREMPLVLQYNKRDLENVLPVDELNEALNSRDVPHFESVATTGLGVEDTLRGITQEVLDNLVEKYGLESGPGEPGEMNMLNRPGTEAKEEEGESVWEDESLVTEVRTPARAAKGDGGTFVIESGDDESLPVAETRKVGDGEEPAFEGRFSEVEPVELPAEVPMASIEIPLPDQILGSLPRLSETEEAPEGRRRKDGLVKSVTIPLNLSKDELQGQKKLRLEITLDINLL